MGHYTGLILGLYWDIMLQLYCGILGLYCDILGLYCGILGLYCDILGLYGIILSLYCDILGLYCEIILGYVTLYWVILWHYTGFIYWHYTGFILWHYTGFILWHTGFILWYTGFILWHTGFILWHYTWFIRKGKVPCLPSVTGFSSKLVFNLSSTTHYYSDWATHCTWLGLELRTSQFGSKCSTDLANEASLYCDIMPIFIFNFNQEKCSIILNKIYLHYSTLCK